MSNEFQASVEVAIEKSLERMQLYLENPHQAHADAVRLAYLDGWSDGFVAACDAMPNKDKPE